MISSGIKLSQNRFAALSRDPDSVLKQPKRSRAKNESKSVQQSQPKGSKGNQAAKNATAKPQKQQKRKENSNGSKNRTVSSPSLPKNDWERKDHQIVEQLFHDDMLQAIELSQQEFEKQKQTKKEQKSAAKSKSSNFDSSKKDENRENNKEKKHKSAKIISLREFHQHVEKSLPLKTEAAVKSSSADTSRGKSPSDVNGLGDYFSNIDKEVTQIERKERRKKNSRPAKATENLSLSNVFEHARETEESSEKDKKIEELQEELQSWKDKFHHVKKRNKQLLVMLQQGEMKEKAELLLEVERLSVIRDELTDNITELHGNLEKERSKVSKLKDELQVTARNKKS